MKKDSKNQEIIETMKKYIELTEKIEAVDKEINELKDQQIHVLEEYLEDLKKSNTKDKDDKCRTCMIRRASLQPLIEHEIELTEERKRNVRSS